MSCTVHEFFAIVMSMVVTFLNVKRMFPFLKASLCTVHSTRIW
ncbi:7991_t:CDS:2 [Rhizophagus irregularis]|nr:7991_t:CDS:2 [Rhizophagus irregularis]